MYKRIKELIASGETFAMETTLATRSGANLIREAQREGYYVTLLYFWLNTPDLAVERVKMRVAAGGHNIPRVLSAVVTRQVFTISLNYISPFVIIDDCRQLHVTDGSNRQRFQE